jgi:hypothetical protein
MEEKKKIEVNEVYKTHVGDLVKIMDIDEENDRLHIFNISEGAVQWVLLSRALKFKIKDRVR